MTTTKKTTKKVTTDKAVKRFNRALDSILGIDSSEVVRVEFKLPQIVTKKEDKIVCDSISDSGFYSYANELAIGLSKDDKLLLDNQFKGYAYLSVIGQNGILHSIPSTLADDCTQKWIEVVGLGDDKDEARQEKIKQIEVKLKDLNAQKVIRDGLFNVFLFGGNMLYVKLEGDDIAGKNGKPERENPLYISPAKIKKGSLKYIRNIEPLYCFPSIYNTDDTFSQEFYNPQKWTVMGKTIHASRMLRMVQNETVNLLKPVYNFFGIPLVQMCIPYVRDFENVRTNITGIIRRYNLNIVLTNMEAILNSIDDDFAAAQNFKQRMQLFNKLRDNFGVLALDKDSEDYKMLTMSLTTLDKLLSQMAEFMCIVPKIPATKLLGISPQGFNSTGDNELTNYYDTIGKLQKSILTHPLDILLQVIQLDLFGEIDDAIGFKFNSLWEMDDKEASEINTNKTNSDCSYYDRGILSAQNIQKRLANDPNSGYNDLEIDEDDLDDIDYEDPNIDKTEEVTS